MDEKEIKAKAIWFAREALIGYFQEDKNNFKDMTKGSCADAVKRVEAALTKYYQGPK